MVRIGLIVLVLLTLVILKSFSFSLSGGGSGVNSSNSTPTPNQSFEGTLIIQTESGHYRVLIRQQQATHEIKLIANFEKQLKSQEVFSQNACQFLINGGFYTEKNEPLGLFFLDGRRLGKEVSSTGFLNGFVALSTDGVLELFQNRSPTLSQTRFVFQSGPYFSLQNQPVPEFEGSIARRALIAQDKKGVTYFLAIHEITDQFSGPSLNEIREILKEVNHRQNLAIEKAINLDGGSTLTFLQSGEESITELQPSGSFLCLKEPSRP